MIGNPRGPGGSLLLLKIATRAIRTNEMTTRNAEKTGDMAMGTGTVWYNVRGSPLAESSHALLITSIRYWLPYDQGKCESYHRSSVTRDCHNT